MNGFSYIFSAGTPAPPQRKIAQPKKKNVSPETRASIKDLINASTPRKYAEPPDSALPSIQPLDPSVAAWRDLFRNELLRLLTAIFNHLRQVEDPLKSLDPTKLADAWGEKTWLSYYKGDRNPNSYRERMEQELADLDLWMKHWDSELEGYEMFRAYIHGNFGHKLTELSFPAEPSRHDGGARTLPGVATVQNNDWGMDVDGMDLDFGSS
jgi:hypothetical protein